MFDIKCKYALRCSGYRDNSYTCTKACDKRYCGIYRQLRNERLVMSGIAATTSATSNYIDKNRFDYDNHDGKKKYENH